ncbi:hypothetical protein PR048_005992 [Dryococelus australis]|uniref:Uncharacterized protein n=1 Tax=Dryococelus australis TaxID=614101 RepID=A0ABQ9I9T7_9NEOP|nr:hypothetical protein PR048_005992 [Dryococelus australis]
MVWIWRKPSEGMDPSCQQGTVLAGGRSIMVQGVFTRHRLGPLVHAPPKLNGNYYKTLLGDHFQPFMDFSFPDNDGMFQQDNVPSHRTVDVQDWFEEHSGEFERMERLAGSPDVNPIVIGRQLKESMNDAELWTAGPSGYMIPARVVLYFLSFTGFLVSFMMRSDINLAMVVMVKLPPQPIAANVSTDSPLFCYDPVNISDAGVGDNSTVQVWNNMLML